MGDLRLSDDQRRRVELNGGVGGPEYSGTFPPESAGSDHVAAESIDPSMRSEDPLNGTSTARGLDLEGEQEAQPRKRKGLFGKLGRSDVAEEPEDPKSLADGPRFTVASQLRATILNSWINLLMLAAPVGSMLTLGCGFTGLLADYGFQLRCTLSMLIPLPFLLSTLLLSCKIAYDPWICCGGTLANGV